MTLQKRPELFWQNNLSTLDVDKLKDFYSDLPENEKNYLGLSLSPKDFQRTLK
jgi:hypothetical protein